MYIFVLDLEICAIILKLRLHKYKLVGANCLSSKEGEPNVTLCSSSMCNFFSLSLPVWESLALFPGHSQILSHTVLSYEWEQPGNEDLESLSQSHMSMTKLANGQSFRKDDLSYIVHSTTLQWLMCMTH